MGRRKRKNQKGDVKMQVSDPDKSTICLNMIVKNEEHVLKELFETIKDKIDYWVISDTGSTDNTVKLIEEYFQEANIPGEVVHHEWQDFGYNRTQALKACRGKADYIWVIDADDLVVGDFQIPKKLTADAYSLVYGTGFTYMRTQIFNNRLDWEYVGVLHEYPKCTSKPQTRIVELKGNYHIDSRRLGDRNKVEDKYLRDALILEEAVKKEPDNSRYVFYLAQSWMDHGEYKKAIYWYRKRARMKGWVEEVYYSKYRIALAMAALNKEWQEIEAQFLDAWETLPSRCEPLYHIAHHYRMTGDHEKSYEYALKGSKIPFPNNQKLFLFKEIYDWKILDELCISGFYAGHYQEAIDAGFKMLKNPNTPRDQHERVRKNLNFSIQKLRGTSNQRSSGKQVICFYAGYSGIKKGLIYGSELAMVNVAERLAKGAEVHIFSFLIEKQWAENGVVYHPAADLRGFKEIDVLVISRYINYFLEFKNNVKKTYIWLHDICFHPGWQGKHIPDNGKYLIQNLDGGIDGYIVLTEWHKALIHQTYDIPMEKLHIIGNGLNQDHFQGSVKKIKNRFIYTSSPNRGLKQLIEYFHEIRKQVPDATLHIFRGKDDFDQEHLKLLDEIKKYKYIRYGGKLLQKELAKEFQKSDVWFYPTTFPETYCMSGLEAQMGGCACVCTDFAALHNTVGERGILLKEKPYTGAFKEEAIGAVIRLLENEEEKVRLQEAGKKWAQEQNWDNIAQKWADLLEVVPVSQTGQGDTGDTGDAGEPSRSLSDPEKGSLNLGDQLNYEIKVVNLDRREDRWQTFQKLFKKNSKSLDPIRFSATDGSKLSLSDELKHLFRNNDFGFRAGVVGCAMSHKRLWQELVDSDLDYYLILEDDIEFCKKFEDKLKLVEQQILEKGDCDVVYVGHSVQKKFYKKAHHRGGRKPVVEPFANRHEFLGGTFGYFVSKRGAQRFLEILEHEGMQRAVDFFMFDNFNEMNVYRAMPHLVYAEVYSGIKSDSDVQNNHHRLS